MCLYGWMEVRGEEVSSRFQDVMKLYRQSMAMASYLPMTYL